MRVIKEFLHLSIRLSALRLVLGAALLLFEAVDVDVVCSP